jgi:acyl-CoA ligase (AMP-forming) (exosortase A-associated)
MLLHQLVERRLSQYGATDALIFKGEHISYATLYHQASTLANSFKEAGLKAGDRVAFWLPKTPQAVSTLLASSLCGAIAVPINPVLKSAQAQHILDDCSARILVTQSPRLKGLNYPLSQCFLVDNNYSLDQINDEVHAWPASDEAQPVGVARAYPPTITESDLAAILYTSGSTGQPKGVCLSHRNLVAGAESVSSYLENTADDILLAVLPLSFDYGLSQLTTAWQVGASTVLLDYLLPQDVIKAVAKYQVTGLAGVPPLWLQLCEKPWPQTQLRYITNSGGAMPQHAIEKLQQQLPNTSIVLMYGLTEAFRSTYLPPQWLADKPGSMGIAIPNAALHVLDEQGQPCPPNTPGELVHTGPLVAQGYWNDAQRSAERFRTLPAVSEGIRSQIAVYSGDTVYQDEDGFFYFVGRSDEQIKSSGYRISPDEIEQAAYQAGATEAAAFGIPDPVLGQAIVVYFSGESEVGDMEKSLKQQLANFMHPKKVIKLDKLPRNPNGKFNRTALKELS